jgi:hypothetical protein
MLDQDSVEQLIARHVLWCREERDRLSNELSLYKPVASSIGRTKLEKVFMQGGTRRISEVQRAIEELDRVIECCSGPDAQTGVSPKRSEAGATGELA